MKKFVFSIQDLIAGLYLPAFESVSKGGAERAFADAVNDPSTPMYKHPEDYVLCELGTFDDGTGMFEVGVPKQISFGKSVHRAPPMPSMQTAGDDRGMKGRGDARELMRGD